MWASTPGAFPSNFLTTPKTPNILLLQGIRISLLRKQPEIEGFWAGPSHHQGPGLGPRQGRPQPSPGGIGAPLPGTRIPEELGLHTSHAPGGPAPTPGAGPFPRRGGVTAVGCLAFLTFRRTNHDHDHEEERAHPEICRQADAA